MASPDTDPSIDLLSYDGRPPTRAFWGGNLPHWDVVGRPIFLTLHVRGAIPPLASARLRRDAAALKDLPDTTYARRMKLIFTQMEAWLDRTDYEPVLTQAEVAMVLREAIAERERRRCWRVLHWVLMPSHLHVLYVGGTVGMKTLMGNFKRWTGHRAARALGREERRFWQDEWFDHWSRSADETERIVAYIRQNPLRAGLVKRSEDWPHASWNQPASGRSGLQNKDPL